MRRHAPAAERNREPIAAVLAEVLPASGTVLEIASGSGQHVAHFAERFPHLTWQPSDVTQEALESVRGWQTARNVLEPVQLDAAADEWPVAAADAIVCINMIHIAPWAACQGLFRGAERLLSKQAPLEVDDVSREPRAAQPSHPRHQRDGVLVLYGPFFEDSEPAPSNAAFDQSLRQRNHAWGVRRLQDVRALGLEHGFELSRRVEMPANNLTVVFTRV